MIGLDSPGSTVTDIEAGTGGVISGGVVCPCVARLLAGSERRGLFEGVDGAARPSQRADRFEGVVAVCVGVVAAEAGLGR